MKIIHCADLHIDSKLGRHFDDETALERRAEILNNFSRLTDFAKSGGIHHIMISGDLFDAGRIRKNAMAVVADIIKANPDITYYYLQGNHDADGFLHEIGTIPENLKTFTSSWTKYEIRDEYGNVVICGAELMGNGPDAAELGDRLLLNGADFNIVMLHGQVVDVSTPGRTGEIIPLKQFRQRGIDYMALGHVHSYKEDRLDGRGIWAYPGCLEGRGFDETGRHGFILLDIDTSMHTFTHCFVPFANRTVSWLEVEITGAESNEEIASRCSEVFEGDTMKDIIRIELVGSHDIETEINTDYIKKKFEGKCFYLDIRDSSRIKIDYNAYLHDPTLKGEFIRRVYTDASLTNDEKAEVIKMGLSALSGRME